MMEQVKPLNDFFAAIEKDGRISITHIGIYAALLEYRMRNNFINPVVLFSHDIMGIAKISAEKTYYKCIRELNDYGYIKYYPSYKNNQGSKVFFNS